MRFGLSFTRLQIWMEVGSHKMEDTTKEKHSTTKKGFGCGRRHYSFDVLSRSFKI